MPTDTIHPHPTDIHDLLQAGIAAAKSGQAQKARSLIMQALEHDEHNVQAWIWLSGVVDSLEERQICLENVLTIDPSNKMAQKGLSLLEKQQGLPQSSSSPAPPPSTTKKPSTPPPPSPSVRTSPSEPTLASKKRKSTSKYRRLKPSASTPPTTIQTGLSNTQNDQLSPSESPLASLTDLETESSPLDNEYSCPYCAAPTQPDDKRCRKCRNNLWSRTPKLEKPSTFFKILLFLQVINTLGTVLQVGGGVALLFTDNPFGDMPALSVFILPFLLLPLLYNVFLLIGLIKRWRFIFYLYLLQAILAVGVVGAVITVIGLESTTALIACGVPLGLLVIGQLFLIFNLGADFTFNEERILLKVDPDDLGATLLKKGNDYAKKNMWALAALHFRQAGYRLADQVDPQVSLAVAYNNLKLYDFMVKPVKQAHSINPGDPRVKKLVSFIKQRQEVNQT